MALVSFSSGQVIRSADINSNYALCVLTDTARTVGVTHTYTASQTFTGGWTAGAACTVSTGGLTVTAGGLTVSAGTSAVQALTATTGVFSGLITGNAGLSTTTGAFTGAVSGITTLSAASLTLTGVATVSQLNPAAAGTFKILGGTTGLSLRNNADSADNLILTDAGAATIRAGLTVTAGGLAVSAGTTAVQALTATTGSFSGTATVNQLNPFSSGTFKILGGSTALSLRNNADSADNLIITDAGAATIRAGLTVTAGGATITAGGLTVTAGATTFGSTIRVPNNTNILGRNAAGSADVPIIKLDSSDRAQILGNGAVKIGNATTDTIGFYGSTGTAQPSVSGSKGANAALSSLMTALSGLGIVQDLTT